MKIWIRTLIAVALAILIGALIPLSWIESTQVFNVLSSLFIHLGQYILFPLVFFTFTVRCYDLIREKKILKLFGKSSLYILLTTFIFSILGTVLSLILKTVPIESTQETPLNIPSIQDFLLTIFPTNFFEIFITDGCFLLPLILFSVLMAIALRAGKESTRPISELFDAASSLFHIINTWFVKYSFIGFFFITLATIFQIRQISNFDRFLGLFLLYLISTLVLVFVIYPIILYFTTQTKNPYKVLFAMLTPAIGAFFSGSTLFATPLTLIHNEKNLRIEEKTNAVATTFGLLFGRAGTAFVTASATILIMKSYTSLAYMGASQFICVILLSFVLSFFTGAFHKQGILATVALISLILNTNNSEHLSLVTIAPILYCFAAFIDTINNTIMTYIINYKFGDKVKTKISNYI